MKIVDQAFLDNLSEQAKKLPRLRTNANFHQGMDDPVQRLFIAMEPDSYVRPHLHSEDSKWEFFFVVRGALLFFVYDESGVITDIHRLSAGEGIQALELPAKVWHSTISCQSDTVFFEVKQGPYQVTNDKGFAIWSPTEEEPTARAFIKYLREAKVGDDASQWQKV